MAFILLIEILAFFGFLLWAIPAMVDGFMTTKRRNKFGQELSRLFELQTLNKEQIEILAKEYFQNLYKEYEQDEPFEGLPSDVRLHLERVRETIGKEQDHMLQPLASQLQDLNDENIRKHKRMWWVSVSSLLLGVSSLAFGAYTHYSPEYAKSNQSAQKQEYNNQIQPTLKGSTAD
jgi:hypothetical protein